MVTDQNAQKETFVALERCLKKRFPFSLACPSFVYRAGYVDNVRHLAPFVDEIQLLFFESRRPESLPGPGLIRELRSLAVSHDITYQIHLPTDLFPGHPDKTERRHAVDTLQEIFHRCESLDPTTFTLHLNPNPESCFTLSFSEWKDHLVNTLERFLKTGISGRRISIENVDNRLENVDDVIRCLDLSVCMDMGHLMACGFDVNPFWQQWKQRVSVLHLHGVEGKKDHLPLDRLSPLLTEQVMKVLKTFAGSVTLEVYSRDALTASMKWINKRWRQVRISGSKS